MGAVFRPPSTVLGSTSAVHPRSGIALRRTGISAGRRVFPHVAGHSLVHPFAVRLRPMYAGQRLAEGLREGVSAHECGRYAEKWS